MRLIGRAGSVARTPCGRRRRRAPKRGETTPPVQSGKARDRSTARLLSSHARAYLHLNAAPAALEPRRVSAHNLGKLAMVDIWRHDEEMRRVLDVRWDGIDGLDKITRSRSEPAEVRCVCVINSSDACNSNAFE